MAELALFFSAFLAATIVPFSSEVAFLAALTNDMPFLSAMFFASSGNIIAIIANYWFGYWLYDKTKDKLEDDYGYELEKIEKYEFRLDLTLTLYELQTVP